MPVATSTEMNPGLVPIVGARVIVRLITSPDNPWAPGYVPSDDFTVSDQWETVTDAGGVWSTPDVPSTDDVVPANSVYIADITPPNRHAYRHVFVLPAGPGPHRVEDNLADPPTDMPTLVSDQVAVLSDRIDRIVEGPLSLRDPRVNCLLDGSDETSKWQIALAMQPAGGGELFLPAGVLTANVAIDRDNLTLIGQGDGSVIKAASGATVVAIGAGVTARHQIVIENLTIDGGFANGRSGIKVNKTNKVTMKAVSIVNTPYAGWWLTGASTEARAFGCNWDAIGSGGDGSTGWGVLGDQDSNGLGLYGCSWTGCVMPAVDLTNCYHSIIHGVFQANGNNAASPFAVALRGGGGHEVDGYFEANGFDQAIAANVAVLDNAGAYCESAVIRGYLFGPATKYGVYVDGAKNVEIEPGTIFSGHDTAEIFISANIAGEGVTADRIRRQAPAPLLVAGPGATALSADLAGGTKRIKGGATIAGGLGVNGQGPQAGYPLGAAATDPASVQALANSLRQMAINVGLGTA